MDPDQNIDFFFNSKFNIKLEKPKKCVSCDADIKNLMIQEPALFYHWILSNPVEKDIFNFFKNDRFYFFKKMESNIREGLNIS